MEPRELYPTPDRLRQVSIKPLEFKLESVVVTREQNYMYPSVAVGRVTVTATVLDRSSGRPIPVRTCREFLDEPRSMPLHRLVYQALCDAVMHEVAECVEYVGDDGRLEFVHNPHPGDA